MRVKEILPLLPEGGWFYQGDPEAEFSGYTLSPRSKSRQGRFFLTRDDSWPEIKEEPQTPSREKTAGLMAKAFANGATGVVCSPEYQGAEYLAGRNVFFTEDAYGLTCFLAALIRESLGDQRMTAVTGSAGKSTVKSMMVHALKAAGSRRVSTNPGNKNLPRMVLQRISTSVHHQHTVLEVSSSALKAFRESGFSVRADVSIITAISPAHLEYIGSMENLVSIKSDLFQLPPAGGTAVINRDTDYAEELIHRAVSEGCQLVTYGESAKATVRLISWDPATQHIVAAIGQQRVEYQVGPTGKHNALNSLAVLAALRAHRIKNWYDGVRSLAEFEPLAGRDQSVPIIMPGGQQITLIDGAYNANPASIRSSVAALASLPVGAGQRRIAVLGDVLQLGEETRQIHRDLTDAVVEADLDQVHLFGDLMGELHAELLEQAAVGEPAAVVAQKVRHWSDLEALQAGLPEQLRTGDTVLMKASGATGLNDWVAELKEQG